MLSRTVRRLALCAALVIASTAIAEADAPSAVTFTGNPQSALSTGVAIPSGAAMFWVSGTPPSAPFGDMKAQGESALANVAKVLQTQGLTLHDVVYLRVYVVADKATGKVDYKGWNDAYAESFANATNPVKTARSTVAVAGLVGPEWLIEIEAFAVYPPRK